MFQKFREGMDDQELYLNQLKHFFRENGFSAEPYQIERLAIFASLVAEKNQGVNLISRKDVDLIIENHIFFSAFINIFLPDKITNFLDIGTGGGFPGLPLAIINPFKKAVLVDSTAKKINAVNEFIDKLKLGNVIAENSRVENPDFISKYSNKFDLIVSRATVELDLLLRYALPLIKEKAYIAAIKGGDLSQEIFKAEIKYRAYIKKTTIFELAYKPTNTKNEKDKKLILLELYK